MAVGCLPELLNTNRGESASVYQVGSAFVAVASMSCQSKSMFVCWGSIDLRGRSWSSMYCVIKHSGEKKFEAHTGILVEDYSLSRL